MTIIYCFDPYCVWCYGFNPVIRNIAENFKNKFHFEVFAGGMILPEQPVHISATASYIRDTYPIVEKLTGVQFGEYYLWHIRHPEESDWYPDSGKPSIALSIFKEYYPEKQIAFATDLQYALHYEGRDLCDDEAYRLLLENHNIPQREFYNKLHDPVYKEKAHYEFALVKQLQVSGYPSVLLQVSDSKFYLLARGYSDYETIRKRIETILNELET